MKKESGNILTADGLQLYTLSWQPDAEPRAILLIIHGYAEHITRYEPIAQALAEQGYAVYGFDHRGHGKSEGLRAYIADTNQIIDDINRFAEPIQQAHPERKCYLFGHSMGSLLSLQFAIAHPQRVDGLIVSGTAVSGDEDVPEFIITIGEILGRFVPTLALYPPLSSKDLSYDPDDAITYDRDPLIYRGRWRIKTGIELVQLARSLRKSVAQIHVPILILHGADDTLVPVSGSEFVHQHINSQDKTLKIFPNMKHEIHMASEVLVPEMLEWLNLRVRGNI